MVHLEASVGVAIVHAPLFAVGHKIGVRAASKVVLPYGILLILIFFAALRLLEIIASPLPRAEELLVEKWIVSLLPVDHNHVHAGHAYGGGVVEGIVDELLLDGDFELAVLLLQLLDNVFHVLLDLVLLFNFKPVLGIRRQLWVVLIILLTNQQLNMIKLSRQQIALHQRQLVCHLTVIGSDFHEPV